MIHNNLSFTLPAPWKGETFHTEQIGSINFLVGPNGSGKSRFAESLRQKLPNARMLGTDRLCGMEQTRALSAFVGDPFANGLVKNLFTHYKGAGQQGSGIDTIVLLEERLDLRIQVEATLGHLFNRKIMIDWDSGNLVARATVGEDGVSYRLDRDECHGIKELLVLLTHLYNDQQPYLIIDEPELNLHPQYQAFFMQEVRKAAGDPAAGTGKKIVFLATHSPFILDFRSVEDIKSVISFGLDHSIPKQLFDLDASTTSRLASLVPRLNVHHKQLFFSDNPIFVEGILDAQLIGTMQEARGVSVAGAGSCIIDAGGCEEVNKYLELCSALGKSAHFLYDLDSLFLGNLRSCVKDDSVVQSFLATAGVGNDFAKYCGELDRTLTGLIEQMLLAPTVPPSLNRLVAFLRNLRPGNEWDKKNLARARVAVATAVSRQRSEVATATSQALVDEVEGRLGKVVEALGMRNVNLLPGGTLERYLPAYSGDHYDLADDLKREAVAAEIGEMSKPMTLGDLSARYGKLYEAVCKLPCKKPVDALRVLRRYLSRYIHDLQAAVVDNPRWQLAEVQNHLSTHQQATVRVFTVSVLTRGQEGKENEFQAVVSVAEMLGQGRRLVRVSHKTNAGMGDFEIEAA
jgi:AAA domain, putative AbiEii toxin, Type IV TA system